MIPLSVYLLLEIRLMTIQLSGLLCHNCLTSTELSTTKEKLWILPRTVVGKERKLQTLFLSFY